MDDEEKKIVDDFVALVVRKGRDAATYLGVLLEDDDNSEAAGWIDVSL